MTTPAASSPINVHAALLAWVWPGLGHLSLGHTRRGALIMFGVLFLFFSGLLIGGVDSVDHRNDRLWFYAQAVNGPIAFVADFFSQRFVQNLPESETKYERIGLARVNEMGTLFIALGGLMNLVVILDALQRGPYVPPDRRRGAPEQGGDGGASRETPQRGGS